MLGFAQKLFIEQGGNLPKNSFSKYVPHQPWPLIDRMLANRRLSYVDYALAERLLRDYPEAGQPAAAFICNLSTAVREGHLCIRIDAQNLFPDPRISWAETGEVNDPLQCQISENDFQSLTQLIIQGSKELPSGLLSEVSDKTQAPICRFGKLFYFQRYWYYETLFIEHLRKLLVNLPSITFDDAAVAKRLNILEQSNLLLKEQTHAISTACQNSLTIICGGPGTGKTYTAGHLIKVYWESLSLDQRERCEIALAAPTGKAAANLQQSISRAVDKIEGFKPIKAKTLHSLLGIRHSTVPKDSPTALLTADLLLVDESSMIDVQLMSHLFSSLKPGARLVLLGDPHQLPPVSAGMLFTDMVGNLPQNVTTLNKCLRTELRTIVEFASTVNQGHSNAALQMLSSGLHGIDHIVLNEENVKNSQQDIMNEALPYYSLQAVEETNPDSLLNMFNRFRILSPLRKGPFGVDTINDKIWKQILQKQIKEQKDQLVVLPIMLVSNDYRLELFNGEVGVLVRFPQKDKDGDFGLRKGDYALFYNRNSGEDPIRKIPALLLPKFEYAYCLSVHKSQGSEFDHVIMLLPKGAEIFGREVLYTALTRAKKKLEIWGSNKTLQETIERRSQRLSGISERFPSLQL